MVTSNYLLSPFGFGFGFGGGNGFGLGMHGPLLYSKGPKKNGPPWVPSGSSGPPGQVGQHGNTSC